MKTSMRRKFIKSVAIAGLLAPVLKTVNAFAIGQQKDSNIFLLKTVVPGYNSGHFLKEFPDWFLKNQPRPSKGRYCFTTWNYFSKDSPLVSSGLIGPVRITKD